RDPNLTAFPFALGAEAGRQDIFISGNSASSSFLPIEEATVGAEPMTAVVGRESVEIRRLDDIAADILSAANAGPILLKLDTQGTERQVMQGGAAALEKIDYILCECSLVPVYKGEPVIEEQILWMREKGFDPISLEPGWSDPETGETYQVDALFRRRR
ncbi:MAG: FkbM family methyltransferase, partial [Oricola sp.]|nr:FkbM family methyltransferase [Oricola sp.]